MNLLKKLGIVIVLLISLSVVIALPPFPDKFEGKLKIDDADAAIGTEIGVYLEGVYLESFETEDEGNYTLFVRGGDLGDSITFKILNQVVGESIRKNGIDMVLDFSVYNDRDEDGTTDDTDNFVGDNGNDIDHNYDDLTLRIADSETINSSYSGAQKVEIKDGD